MKNMLFSRSDDCTIEIWNFYLDGNKLYILPLKVIDYHKKGVNSLLTSGIYILWQVQMTKLCPYEILEIFLHVWNWNLMKLVKVFNRSKMIQFGSCSRQTIILMDSPINTSKFLIYGERSKVPKFIKYALECWNPKHPEHDPTMDQMFLSKWNMNILHIYNSRDMPKHLAPSFKGFKDMSHPDNKNCKLNGVFTASKSKQTPLSLSLFHKHTECINVTEDF